MGLLIGVGFHIEPTEYIMQNIQPQQLLFTLWWLEYQTYMSTLIVVPKYAVDYWRYWACANLKAYGNIYLQYTALTPIYFWHLRKLSEVSANLNR